MSRKQFNLEDYLKHPDWKVETRDGIPVNIKETDIHIHGMSHMILGEYNGCYEFWNFNGRINRTGADSNLDIFLVITETEPLTEFENKLIQAINFTHIHPDILTDNTQIKVLAESLLEVAHKSEKINTHEQEWCPIEGCDYGIEIALNILQKTYGKVDGYQTDDGIREHQTAIEAVKNAGSTMKWSKGDENILEECIKCVERGSQNVNQEHGIICWLKSLRPQPKPKCSEVLTWEDINELEDLMAKVHYEFRNGISAEGFGKEVLERFLELKEDENMDDVEQSSVWWNDEDEKVLSEVKLNFELNKDKMTPALQECYNKFFEKLKSHHYWKPTKEQMMALTEAMSEMDSIGDKNHEKYADTLHILFDDLRKL